MSTASPRATLPPPAPQLLPVSGADEARRPPSTGRQPGSGQAGSRRLMRAPTRVSAHRLLTWMPAVPRALLWTRVLSPHMAGRQDPGAIEEVAQMVGITRLDGHLLLLITSLTWALNREDHPGKMRR